MCCRSLHKCAARKVQDVRPAPGLDVQPCAKLWFDRLYGSYRSAIRLSLQVRTEVPQTVTRIHAIDGKKIKIGLESRGHEDTLMIEQPIEVIEIISTLLPPLQELLREAREYHFGKFSQPGKSGVSDNTVAISFRGDDRMHHFPLPSQRRDVPRRQKR